MPQNSPTLIQTSGGAIARETRKFKESLMVQFGRASERLGVEVSVNSITLCFNSDTIIANAAIEGIEEFDLCDVENGINIGVVYLNITEENPTKEDERKAPPGFYIVFLKGTSAELRDSTGFPVLTDLPVDIITGEMASMGQLSGGIVIKQRDGQTLYKMSSFAIVVGGLCGPAGNPGVGKG